MRILLDFDLLADPASGPRHVAKEVREAYASRWEEIPGVVAKRDARPEAIEAYGALAADHDVWIVFAAPATNPSAWSGAVDWVIRHLGAQAAAQLVGATDFATLQADVLIAPEARGFAGRHLAVHAGEPDWAGLSVRLAATG